MTISLWRLLTCFCIITSIWSCKQNSVVEHAGTADVHETDSLIALGKKLQNSHIDSLPLVAKYLSNIAQRSGNKKALVFSGLYTAQYYWLSGNHQRSMEVAVKCLAAAEKWHITEAYTGVYNLIGNLHKENNNYKPAFEAEQKGLHWAIADKDTAGIISFINLKAMFIHTQAEIKHVPAQSDSSVKVFFEGLKIAETSPKFEGSRIPFYDNIAEYYLNIKEYSKAIYYGEKGVELALKYNRPRSLTYSYSWLGQAYFFKGNRLLGIGYLNKALKISRDYKEPYREMEIYGHLHECYYSAGNYKKAIGLMNRSKALNDSLQIDTHEKQMSELEIKYETAKKDKEILLLDHDKKVKTTQLLIILGGSVLGIIFSIILILQYRIIRRNHRLIKLSNEKKDKALEDIAFIQAHELRRPLSSIMGLINVIKATDYEFDPEYIEKLEKAAEELDEKIYAVLAHVKVDAG